MEENDKPESAGLAPELIAPAFIEDEDESGLTPAAAAATLVIFREAADGGDPALLMVRRSDKMVFAAGAAVFPGGRVDEDDHRLATDHAAALGLDPRDAAARIAAIRETLEETGLPVGLRHDGDGARLTDMRAALHAGTLFSTVMAEHGAALDLRALTPFARWRPNFAHARVFDTRFYLSQLNDGPLHELSVDANENSELFWSSARDTLARADAGEVDVIFPTRRNLERLAQFGSFAAAAESARRYPPRRITPTIERRGEQRFLCIPEDCGYPVTSEAVDSAMRG